MLPDHVLIAATRCRRARAPAALGGLAAVWLIGLAAAAAAAPLSVETVSIDRSTDLYDIAVAYPRTGLGAIDDPIAEWVTAMVGEFAAMAEEDLASVPPEGGERPPWAHYALDLGFDVARNDEAMFVVGFDEGIYTGGAHPNHDIETYNFLMPDGWRVYLPEILDGRRALDRISALAIADLARQFGPDAMSDDDWLRTGAGPHWDNFADFLLLADRLVLRFPPYQVAAYAAGDQTVEIPLSDLAGYMRQDWRRPVPSFDCARAESAAEKAICSDVVLARLDRALAGAYERRLEFADAGEQAAIKSAQRAWLGSRNACGGDIACLTAAYRARLDALGA